MSNKSTLYFYTEEEREHRAAMLKSNPAKYSVSYGTAETVDERTGAIRTVYTMTVQEWSLD